MILLHSESLSHDEDHRKIILVFGNGLIGRSIVSHIKQLANFSVQTLPFGWSSPSQADSDARVILECVRQLLVRPAECHRHACKISFVWSAGKAGFSASQQEILGELASYQVVLSLALELVKRFPDNDYAFHLMSSAGGLFENQGMVGRTAAPAPVRPYGELKYRQESLLVDRGADLVKYIYRPTSVYGYSGAGQRMGLIPTLIANGYKNKTSTIYGSLSTLRDYVLNNDVGIHVAKNLIKDTHEHACNVHTLATGKPSSIYEIKYFVEQAVGKKIFLSFIKSRETDNSVDITVNSRALPEGWSTTDTKTGIRYVKEAMVRG